MGFKFDFVFFVSELGVAFAYIPVVLVLALVPLAIGIAFGFLIACSQIFRVRFLSEALEGAVVFIRGIPVILQLTVIYLFYNATADRIGALFHVAQKADGGGFFAVALIGLSVSASVNLSGAILTAFRSVDRGQFEAGYSVGMTSREILFRIAVPQALPIAMPLIGNNLISLIKNSSVASLIGVVEIIAATQMRAIESYKFLEGYFAAALVYWALCSGIEALVKKSETVFGAHREEARHG